MTALRAESDRLPPIALHLHLSGAETGEAVIRSITKQVHCRWSLYITTDGHAPALPDDPRIHVIDGECPSLVEGLIRTLEVAQSSHIVPLSRLGVLTPCALIAFTRALAAAPGAVLYADQDEVNLRGRHNPWLKPEWDEDLFLAQDYISDACALPVAVARNARIDLEWPDDVAIYALLAEMLLRSPSVNLVHVPYIAVSLPEEYWRRDRPARMALVSAVSGLFTQPGPFGTLQLARSLPSPPPMVSVIVPTRDRVELLRTCISGVLHNTNYPAIEIVIADNNSVERETLAYLADVQHDPRVKVVRWPLPYNYSAVNNFAVTHASGAYLCLLNNDTEVIDPEWLSHMIAEAVRPEVGAVGARLLYPDGSIQHAGVVVGIGNAAGHAHRGLENGAPGYFAQAYVTRRATAVTAACLVVARDKFEVVGGLDEQHFGVAYNDVDLCLKLQAAGWRNIYAPQAIMIHHEGKSRGVDFAPEHLERYNRELTALQERWKTVGFIDPAHHPGLDPASELYRLRL